MLLLAMVYILYIPTSSIFSSYPFSLLKSHPGMLVLAAHILKSCPGYQIPFSTHVLLCSSIYICFLGLLYNKLPQTGGLKTTEIYSTTILEARSMKSRCWQGSRGESVGCLPLSFYRCRQSLAFFSL